MTKKSQQSSLLSVKPTIQNKTNGTYAKDGNSVHLGPIFDNLEGNLLSADKLAERLQITVKTVRNWRYKRVLPDHCMMKVGQRLVKYRWDKVLEWLTETNGGFHEHS